MAERSVTVRLLALTSQYDEVMRRSGRVTADLGTQAQLSGAQVTNLNRALNDSGNSAAITTPKFSALRISIAALGPAIIPLGAAAAGGITALASMGTAGALAFKGISAEMAAATPLGKAYTSMLDVVQSSLGGLEHTAALNLFGSVHDAAVSLESALPDINSQVALFSRLLGTSGDNLIDATLVGFHDLEPVIDRVASDFAALTEKAKEWAESGALSKFNNEALTALPGVEKNISEIVAAIGHLVAAITPLGMSSLNEIGLVAKALDAIPLPVLEKLIPLVTDTYLAFKLWQGLDVISAKLTTFTAKINGNIAAHAALATSATTTGTALSLEEAQAAETAALFDAVTASEAADAARVAAAVEGSGAIQQAVMEATAATAAAAATAYEAAQARVVAASAETVTAETAVGDAAVKMQLKTIPVVGLIAAAYLTLQKPINDLYDSIVHADAANTKLANDMVSKAVTAGATKFVDTHSVAEQQAELAKLQATWNDLSEAQQQSPENMALKETILGLSSAMQTAASQASILSGKQTDAATAINQTAISLNTATDAATAFTNALTGLSAAAGGDVVRSQDAVQQQLNQVAQALHDGKGAFDQYTTAGLNSRDAVDQSATSAANYAAQVYSQTGSISDAEAAYNGWYQALVKTATQQGVSKQALDGYLSSVGQLPTQVDTALKTMTTVGQDASGNLAGGLSDGINANTDTLSGLGTYVGTTVGSAAQAQMAQAGVSAGAALVNNLIGVVDAGLSNVSAAMRANAENFNLTLLAEQNAQGGGHVQVGINAAQQEQASGFIPIPDVYYPSSSGFRAGSGGSSGKTAAQTALDKITAQDDLLHAQALAAIDPTNKLALAQEAVTDATRRLNNETTKGTTAYYQDLQKLHQAQSDLSAEIASGAANRTKALSDMATAQKQLATDTLAGQKALASDGASYQALLDSEAASTSKFYADLASAAATHAANDKKLLDQRQADIEGFASADQQALVQWGSSLTWLSANVADQADQIVQWMDLLAEARSRGVSDDVITALGLDQGPQALGQLKQFSTATQAQIDALNKAVAAKNAAAGQEVTTEAANNYGALGQALVSEQQAYADSVTQLQQQFTSDMASLASQADQALQQILDDRAKMAQTLATDQQAVTASQYGQVGVAGAMSYVTPGTALYTENADGTFTHIPNVPTLQALPKDTPVYDKLFDAGGILPPGRTVAYNGTGKNEHVLTDSQLAAIGGSSAPEVRVYIGNQEITGFVTQVVAQGNAAKRQAILVAGSR